MKFFESCRNCKYSLFYRGLVWCALDKTCRIIKFHSFMGGSRRCECYERLHRPKREKFQYPKKEKDK